jgi:hypothetical protein
MDQVRETSWRRQPALEMLGPGIRCTVAPSMGGKIVSLVDEDGGGEWLVGPGLRNVKPVAYGAWWLG